MVGLVMQMAFMYFMYTNMSSKKKVDPSKAQAETLTSVSPSDAVAVATPLPTAAATPGVPELPSWMPAEVRDMMKVATESQSGKRNVPAALSWFEDLRSSSIRDSKASKYVPAWAPGTPFGLHVYLSECPQPHGAWPLDYEQEDWSLPLPSEESGWYTSSLPRPDAPVPGQWSLMGDKVKAWTTRASQRIGATNGIARARRNDTYTGLLRVDSSACDAAPGLLWKVSGLQLENVEGQDVEQVVQVALPARVQENSTAVYAHIYLVSEGGSLTSPTPPHVVHWVHPLIKLLKQKPVRQTFNLLGGEDEDGKRKPRQEARFGIGISDDKSSSGSGGGDSSSAVGEAGSSPTPSATPDPATPLPFMPYWKPSMHIEPVMDFNTYAANGLPPNVKSHMQLDPSSFRPISPSAPVLQASFLPLLHVNDFWVLGHHLHPVNSSSKTVPLHLRVGVAPMWRWALQTQMSATWDVQASMGTTGEGDNDMIKTIIMDTNPVLLGITMLVSLLHMVFDFLAFRNDISFWRSAKSLEGLSVRTLTLNLVQQAIIAAYLFNENTSWMILTSQVVGLAIEIWKLRKAVAVSLSWHRVTLPLLGTPVPYPWVDFTDKEESYAASRTKEYDDIATAHLLFILYPLVIGYALYSLFYDRHRSWMSWLLGSLVGFVYTFGFAQMVPQLYINYRLKSVAHMPWRAMVYKALNTFIDDLFAFVVKVRTCARPRILPPSPDPPPIPSPLPRSPPCRCRLCTGCPSSVMTSSSSATCTSDGCILSTRPVRMSTGRVRWTMRPWRRGPRGRQGSRGGASWRGGRFEYMASLHDHILCASARVPVHVLACVHPRSVDQ